MTTSSPQAELVEAPSQAVIDLLRKRLQQTVFDNPYIPVLTDKYGNPSFPSIPQITFLTSPCPEMLYGGQAGSGKSGGLLASALQYVQYQHYHAVLLRRSYKELEQPGALIPMSQEWLGATDARYDGQQHRWTFPSGATLSFGYVENMTQLVREYKGSAFAFFGFDELTEWEFTMYRYLFSRRRKPAGCEFPVRTRATSNPGGIGHDWVRDRFVYGSDGVTRLFVPACLDDNPGLDAKEYRESLNHLDPLTKAQLGAGDWNVKPEGTMFRREWFSANYIDAPPRGLRYIRYWDLAATKQDKDKAKDPDWCSGCLIGADDNNRVFICDMRHFRESPLVTEERVSETADADGTEVSIRIEQEPGASAKLYIASLAQKTLPAYDVAPFPTNGIDKVTRAKPFSAACQRGSVFIVRGNWNHEFLDELCIAKGSLISTIAGDIPIESVEVGDLVATRGGWRRVIKSGQTNKEAIVWKMRTRKGLTLVATPNHPVWVTGYGFKRVDHIRAGDALLSFIAESPSICIPNQRRNTFVERSITSMLSCIDTFGNARLGRFLSGITSTIMTAIRGTTNLQTLDVFQHQNTSSIMLRSLGSIRSEQRSARYVARHIPPRNSRDHSLVQRSVETSGSMIAATNTSMSGIASDAGNLLTQPISKRGFAASNVHRNRYVESFPSKHARTADQSLNLSRPSFGFAVDDAVSSLCMLKEKQDVYNLKVEGCEEYFANGILVHNCAFNAAAHDDQVDASGGGYNALFADPEFVPKGGALGTDAAESVSGEKWPW